MSVLFDANAYGPERTPRKPSVREQIETVPILTDDLWRGVSRRVRGVVHAITNRPPSSVGGRPVFSSSCVSYCGMFVEPHTFADGEVVLGCRKCIDRGALYRAVAA